MIGNEDITHMPEHKRHRRIGRVYQDPARGTCPSMTILENMSMADNKGKPFNLMPCVNRKKTEEYRAMLAQLGLGGNLVADLILAGIDSVLDITNNLQVQGHKRRCHHLLCHTSRTSRFRLIAMSPTQQ